jgi:DNA-binding protein H-NS
VDGVVARRDPTDLGVCAHLQRKLQTLSADPEDPRAQIYNVPRTAENRKLARDSVFPPEITMAKVNLSGMSVEALMDLRKRVDETLHKRRAELEMQLERMGAIAVAVRGGGSVLKGKKVPPKYRGPSGETWAGRGAKPRWLVAAIKSEKNSTIS